jgi:hypothetical protein
MKIPVHAIITDEALKLLPRTVRDFFEQEINGKRAIDWVMQGSREEDTAIEPLGSPMSLHTGELVKGDIPEDALVWLCDGIIPWVEHFWSHELGYYGLTEPYFSSLTYRSAPERAENYWNDYVIRRWNENQQESLYYLGRVVHLLEDMGVPAHVHNDPHPSIGDWVDDDDFEDYVLTKMNEDNREWQADPPKNLVFYNPNWVLRDFFEHFATITQLYDSDDVDGLGDGKPYRWDDIEDSYEIHRDATGDLTDYACHAIADDLLPLNFGFVAGLYLKFLKDIGHELPQMYSVAFEVNKIHIYEDEDLIGPGEISMDVKLCSEDVGQLGTYKLNSGESKTINHQYPAFIIDKDKNIEIALDISDNDSWWLNPGARDSLGFIKEICHPDEWKSWVNEKKSFSIKSSNDDCAVDYSIEIITDDPYTHSAQDTELAKISSFSIEDMPFTLFNKNSFFIHKSTCGKGQLMKRENKIEAYMFPYEVTKAALEGLQGRKSTLRDLSKQDLSRKSLQRCRNCFREGS